MYVVLLLPARPILVAGAAVASMAVLQGMQYLEMRKLRRAWAPDPVRPETASEEPEKTVVHNVRKKVRRA